MEMLHILLTLSRRDPRLGRLSPAGLSPAPGTTVHSNQTHSYAKFCNQALELKLPVQGKMEDHIGRGFYDHILGNRDIEADLFGKEECTSD